MCLFPLTFASMTATAIVIQPRFYAGGWTGMALAGTSETPIWIGGVPGQAPRIIDVGGRALLIQPKCVVVQDMQVRSVIVDGIRVEDDGEYANPTAARLA